MIDAKELFEFARRKIEMCDAMGECACCKLNGRCDIECVPSMEDMQKVVDVVRDWHDLNNGRSNIAHVYTIEFMRFDDAETTEDELKRFGDTIAQGVKLAMNADDVRCIRAQKVILE